MRFKPVAVIACLSLLAGCGSDTTSSVDITNGTISGSLSFNYTGAGSGTYNATGAVSVATLSSTPYVTTWAMGFKNATDNSTNFAANIPKSGGTSDFALVSVKGQSTGTVTIDPSCSPTNTNSCSGVALLLGQNSSATTFSYLCTLTSGSITIASLSGTTATGTFSGSGTCFTGTGTSSAWVVTNGAFNVPVLPNVPATLK